MTTRRAFFAALTLGFAALWTRYHPAWRDGDIVEVAFRAPLEARLTALGYPRGTLLTATLVEQHYPKAEWLRDRRQTGHL